MESGKVQISSKIFVLLVLSLLGAFVIIAYLMGRESARRDIPAIMQTGVISSQVIPSAPPAVTELSTQTAAQPPPAALPSYGIPQAPESQATYAYHAPATPGAAAPSSGGNAAAVQQPSGNMADREQVTQYFSSFDQIGATAKSFDDPNAYAQEMLKQVTSGDTSGIDKLIESYKDFHNQIGRLNAPATCKEHQRQTMAVVSRSIGNLNELKSAIGRGDINALTRITGDMKSVEEQSRQVDRLASQIKTQYGIK